MVCIYNPDNYTQSLLKDYENILGSYEAAYYVLCQNNGYGLDKTPTGANSQLYQDLVNAEGRESAIRKKAMTYTKPFYDNVGDWTMGQGDPTILDANGEPKMSYINGTLDPVMQDIMNNHFLRDKIDDTLNMQDYQTDPTDPQQEGVALQRILAMSYDNYIADELKRNTNHSADGVRKAKRKASHEWYKRKVKQIVQEQQITLAKAFGLDFVTNNDGSIELRGTEEFDTGNIVGNQKEKEIKQLRIKFVQNLNYDPLEDERRTIIGELPLGRTFKETDEYHQMYVADAVSDSIHEDMFTSKNGLIYISLNNGTCSTVNKVLAYHYIMSYYDSKLVQSAIDAILPDNQNMSVMYKVNKLIDYLTGVGNRDSTGSSILDKFYANLSKDKQYEGFTEDQQKQLQFFNEFWQQFDELNDQVINKGVNSKQARRKILSTLAAAIIVNYKHPGNVFTIDREVPTDYYFRYMPSSKERLRQQQDKYEAMLNELKVAYQNRVERAQKTANVYVDQKQISRIMMLLNDIEQYNYTNPGDVKSALKEFLETGITEIYEANQKLNDAGPSITILDRAKSISLIYSDTIGFYNALINRIDDVLRDSIYLQDPIIKTRKDQFISDLRALQQCYMKQLSETSFKIVDQYVDKYWGNDIVTPQQKENLKANCHRFLQNQAITGDIAAYETFITMNTLSKSNIVRIVHDAINTLDKKRDQIVRKKAVRLADMLEKTKKELLKQGKFSTALLGSNFQKIFQELDEEGKPTGFLTRKYNYGKFYKLRRSFIDQLAQKITEEIRQDIGDTKFKLQVDNRNNIIFPEEVYFDKYYKQYLLELNHFDCTHANKQYTEEYYEIRIKTLSRKTLKAMSDIQEKIDIILSPVTQDGAPHPEKLDKADLIELMKLQIMQDSLYSRYDVFGNLKTGDDFQISEELRKFRDLVKDGREYDVDWQRYNDTVKNMTPQEKQEFEKYMTTWQITPEFWDMYDALKQEYREQFPDQCKPIFDRMDEINKERRELLIYADTGHFNKSSIEFLSDETFLKVKDLDIERRQLSEQLTPYIEALGDAYIDSPAVRICDFGLYETTVNGQTISKFEKFFRDAEQKDKDESNATGVITTKNVRRAMDLYTIQYVGSDGNIYTSPTSAFSYLNVRRFIESSLLQRFNITDPTKLIQIRPNKIFNKLVGGRFMNPSFDSTINERLQPKEENPQFNKIESNRALYELYKELLDTIAEVNSMIPNSRANSNYRLPQMGASTATMFSRGDIYNPIPAIQYGLDRQFNVKETDTEINDDFYTLPDGTRVNNVPLRYIQMLEDPSSITADVVGSVIAYYNMGVNFKLKSESAPILELLMQQVSQNSTAKGVTFSGTQTSQYSKLKNVMESKLYENDAVWGTNRTEKLSTSKKRVFKVSKFFSTIGTLAALAHNFISYGTGFIDASARLFANAIQHDSFGLKNYFKAIHKMLPYIASGQFLLSVGQYLPNNKISALMHRIGISTGTAGHFKDTHKSRFRRSIKDVKTGMAGFRVSDYLINGALTTMIYDNHRYYEKDGVGTFLQETEWINRYLRENPNSTPKEARKKYNKADVMFNAFEYDRKFPIYGKIRNTILKDKYKLSEKELSSVESNVSKIVENLAAKFNGAVPSIDQASAHQNVFTKMFLNLRNYLVNDFQTRWVTGEDFQKEETSSGFIRELKARRNELKKRLKTQQNLLKRVGKNKDLSEILNEIQDKITQLNAELSNSVSNSSTFNKKYLTDTLKAFFMGIPTGVMVGSTLDASLTTLLPSLHGVVFASSAVLGGLSAAAIQAYNSTVNGASIIVDKKLSIQDQIASLEYIKNELLKSDSDEFTIDEINNLDRKIEELENLHNMNKGIANFTLRQMFLGYNRAMGSALNTLIRKLKFFMRTHFVNSWKDLSDIDIQKYKPKFTQQEKIGIRRLVGDITNIMFWMIISCVMYGWHNDNPDLVMPAKIADSVIGSVSDNDEVVRNALRLMYNTGDDALEYMGDLLLNNEPMQDSSEWLYQLLQNNNVIPLDNDILERMLEMKLEMVLGKKAKVKSKTGTVKYSKEANYKQLKALTKGYFALQSVRAFQELIQPYDPTSLNDMLSTPSATNNVNFKEIEQGVQLFVDEMDGKSDKLTQRGPYTTFKKQQYHIARGPLRITGIPTLFEETSLPGIDSRLRYSTHLGFMPLFFPQKSSVEIKHKNKKH